jgi:hypothetical protein
LEKSSRADHKSENMKYFVVLFLVVCYLHLNSVESAPAPGDDAHPVCAKEAESVSTFSLYTLLANNERKFYEILLNSCIKVAGLAAFFHCMVSELCILKIVEIERRKETIMQVG